MSLHKKHRAANGDPRLQQTHHMIATQHYEIKATEIQVIMFKPHLQQWVALGSQSASPHLHEHPMEGRLQQLHCKCSKGVKHASMGSKQHEDISGCQPWIATLLKTWLALVPDQNNPRGRGRYRGGHAT